MTDLDRLLELKSKLDLHYTKTEFNEYQSLKTKIQGQIEKGISDKSYWNLVTQVAKLKEENKDLTFNFELQCVLLGATKKQLEQYKVVIDEIKAVCYDTTTKTTNQGSLKFDRIEGIIAKLRDKK